LARRGIFKKASAQALAKDVSMANEKKIFTWYQNKWHEGDVRILGAASHGTWLGSVIFDGARYFEGVAPDLDRHCARANESARVLEINTHQDAEGN